MHADGVDVFNKANGNLVVVGITDNFKLKLFPAEDTFLDKNLTYKDCEPCHRAHGKLTGPYLGDLIHASHYGNEQFVAANGNCWSCHAMNSAGGQGDHSRSGLAQAGEDLEGLGADRSGGAENRQPLFLVCHNSFRGGKRYPPDVVFSRVRVIQKTIYPCGSTGVPLCHSSNSNRFLSWPGAFSPPV